MISDVIELWGGVEVTALDVYRDMFRIGEGYIQSSPTEPAGEFKSNPIGYMRNIGAKHGRYVVIFESTLEQRLPELQNADFAIMNGITYFGRKNISDHANRMYAMIFDLDDVTETEVENFLSGAIMADAYPVPNYLIMSGHGLHLYYLLEEPIPLYPNIRLQLKSFKYALTERIWNAYTSRNEKKQMQGIFQEFRVIGGRTKKDCKERRVRAFKLSTHPYSLDTLGRYVPEAVRVDEDKLFRESKMTLAEAKKRYPEWYERVVLGKEKARKRWEIEQKVHGSDPYALYHWWLKQIIQGAAYTHRYFCVMCLAIYAVKCNVPYETVREDAYKLIPFLNAINPSQPFTRQDVESALECYDERYATFPRRDIEALSAIQIAPNKRNGRPQAVHMKIMSSTRDILYPDGSWKNTEGRPIGSGTKEQMVLEYVREHPGESVTAIARALGISRTTVYKYKISAEEMREVYEQEFEKYKKLYGESVIVQSPEEQKFEIFSASDVFALSECEQRQLVMKKRATEAKRKKKTQKQKK